MTKRMSNLKKWMMLPLKLVRRISMRGFSDAAKWVWSHLSTRYREWSLGIKTEDYVEVDELGYSPDCNGYEPISYTCFDTAMAHIDIQPGESVFLDYGCGKGRAVVLAATYPFHKVIGVEMSPELCTIAEDNVRRACKKLTCQNVEIVCSDATTYELPPEVTTIFLWNSFTGHVLASVLDQIHDSLAKTPRHLMLIYMLPYEDRDMIAEYTWLTERRELTMSFWTGVRVIVYESRGRSAETNFGESTTALIGY